MKKILISLFIIIFALTACGKQNPATDNTDENQPVSEKSSEVNTEPGESVVIVTDEKKPGEYVPTMLSEFVSAGTYYMRQKTTEDGKEAVIEVAVTGDKAAKKDSSGTQIIEGQTLYFVIPEQKVVLTSPVDESMKKGFTAIINVKTEEEAKNALLGTGKEAIKDVEYTYEEYKNTEGKLVRYYFDSKTIKYIKQFDNNGTEKLTEILEFSTKIPEGFMDVPDGYIVQDLSKLESSN